MLRVLARLLTLASYSEWYKRLTTSPRAFRAAAILCWPANKFWKNDNSECLSLRSVSIGYRRDGRVSKLTEFPGLFLLLYKALGAHFETGHYRNAASNHNNCSDPHLFFKMCLDLVLER